MSAMRKKTLYELVQERAEQNLKQSKIDTSAYTDKPMKSSNNSSIKAKVDSIYKKQNEDDIFTRVRARAENILNDTKNLSENFILGIGKSGKSSLSYIEEISNQNFNSYNMRNKQISKMNKDKDFNKSVLNGSNTLSKGLPTKENLRLQNNKISTDNAQKIKLQESKQMVSPITDYVNELIEKDEQKIQENIENSQTKIGKKVSELTPSIGQSVAGMAVSTINPALGLSFWQTSAGGDYTREGKNKGLNNKQALLYGSIMGAMESATEAIGAKLTTGVGKAVFKDGAKEGLKAFGLDVAENFFEEAIMEPIQESVMKATGGQADWSNISQRMLESGINGALTSVIMGGASAGIGKATKLITKIENNQQIDQKEITDTLKEINNSEEVDIEKILVDSFKFTAQDLMKNTDVQKNVNTKLENIAEQLSTSEANNFLASKQNILNEEHNTKEQDTIENKRLLNNNQQTNQTDNKIAENQTLEQIEDIKQNLGKILQKDKYKDNEKANNFFKSAIENDIDISNEKVEALFDLPNARGVETKFDIETFKNIDGNIKENINALYITDREGKRSIIYNPKAYSETVIEKNTIHETFHDMAGTKEAQEIADFVYNKMKDNTDFQEAYDTLKEMYSNVKDSDGNILYNKNSQEFENMVKEEAVADYLGTNLGTQEYINELVNGKESRNIAQKIYDAIVNFLDKVTGYKSEEAYLRGLKDKFEKAFNAEYIDSEENSKYSILTNSKNQRYVKADRQVITGNNYILWEEQVQNYINETIRNGKDVNVLTEDGEVLTITENTAGKAKFRNEVIDKNGNKRRLNNKEFLSKLTAETHIDELAEISKQTNKQIVPDYKNHSFAKDGFNYRIAYFEDFDGQYYKITMSIGKNGDINTIYNIGKMDKKNRSKFSLVAQRPSNNNVTSNEELTSINSITNSNEDVNTTRYSMQEDKRNTLVQDNKGRTLTKEQIEYFKDSKAIDEKGNLVNVYHTTTDRVPQFNEFNPVGTRGYRFGEQAVNYFTDSQEMSGSYANQSYKEANTQKITTDKEVKDYLSNLDSKYFNFILKSYDDGSYRIERNPNLSKNSFYSNLQEELNNLKLKDKETYTKLIDRALILNNPYDLFEGTKKSKLDDFLYNFDNKYGEYTAGETARNILEYINNEYEDIKFENKDDLYRNLMQKMQQKFPRTVGTNNIQYQGYVNLQNPYIIDAEGRNWNSVKLKQNEKSLENLSKISSLQRKEISNLFQEEKVKSDDVNRKYTSSRQVLEKLGEIDNSIYSWFDFLTFKEDSDTERTEAFLNLIEDTKGMNRQEIFDHIYKQELTKDQKAIISGYGNNIIRDSSNIKTIKELYDNMDYYSKTEKFKNNSLKENFKRKIKEAFSDKISIDLNELYQLAERNFSNDVIDDLYSQKQTTNDVVKQVIEMNKNGANYDGLIIKNTIDYGGYSATQKPANLYVTFDSNQFKANDNLSPTTDKDIRYSQNTTNKWQEYLEKHKINKEGTRTTLGEIKLPKKKEIKMPQNLNKAEVINMPIDKIFQYKTEGGHRTEETINKLKEDIENNGIQNPIELIRDEDGKIKINNGNHRLEIAKQLGLKEVPVTYKDYANIDKIDKSMYDANNKDLLKYVEEYTHGNNRNSKEVSSNNGRSRAKQEYNSSNRIKSEDKGTAGGNDKIYGETQGIYNRPSGTTTFTQDIIQGREKESSIPSKKGLENKSSSFNLPKNNPTVKSKNYEQKQRNTFKKNMSSMLGISQFNQNNKALFDISLNQLRSEYNQRGRVSEEVRNDIFNDLYNNLIKEDRAFYDENKYIKDEIRTTKLYIDDNIKRDIVDYNDFRKNSMGSVFLTSDENNISVDTYYKELTEKSPILFPDTIINSSDQLKRIVEVSKSIRRTERNIAEYADKYMAKEYRQYAQQEFNSYVDNLEKEYKTVDRYNQEKIKENIKEDYIRPEVEEIKFIYENRNKLQKEVEKQEKYLLLTNREKAIVDRLLKDEMDINEILPGLNKEGIVKSYYARQQLDYMKEQVKQYKNDVKQNLKDVADSLTIDADKWKDKKAGIWYSRETAIRNIQDIMSRGSADRVNKELFEPIIHNTSEQTRFLNNYAETIENLNLDKKLKYDWKDENGKNIKVDEATLAQLLIEKTIDNNYLKGIGVNVERINTIANTFENILKETVNQMDDVYIRFGYAPVEKRQNYFPHFIENKPDTFVSKFANAFGFEIGQDNLPTDIAGRTETFKPGRAFDRNILQRTTNKTDYNALKALDMYMQGASDIIYHTEDIQKLRAFNDSIRNRFKTSEIQKKLDAINENIELTDEERVFQRQQIKDAIKTPLNNLVTWLDEYTNVIANKKSSADRQMEKDTSRQAYTTMKDIEGKIASNLIGGNVSVALTNFAPLAQATGTTKLGNILIGMIQTTQNTISEMTSGTGDNFVYESDFLTSRRGNNLTQKETFSQNVSNIVSKPMEIIDNFTSESIVRAKYRENIKKGMEHQEALKNADMYARNLMADRSKGAMPTLFNRTNPATKLLTAFQIEPNNIISNYFKDMPKDSRINKQNLAWQITKLSVASYAFNAILKSIRGGGDVIPNPIGIVSQLIALAMHNLDDNDENDEEVDKVLTSVFNDFLGSVPFGNAITTGLTAIGVEGFEDSGKLMVSGAVPNGKKVAKLFDGDVSNEYKKQVIANELTKPLLYLGLPTGGAQVAKTAKGLYSYIQGGSYSYDTEGKKSLQFPVEQNPVNAVKSTVFGKYSLPRAQKYLNNNFDGLNPKQTEVYDNSNIGYDKIKEYFDYSSQKGIKQTNKIEYINKMNLSEEDKWNLYKYNIISDSERKDGSSQLKDAEYAIKNKLTTKSEYMKLLEKATKNNMDFPDKDNLKELKQNGLSLKTYIDYKVNYKNASETKKNKLKHMLPVSEESKNLNLSEKVDLMKNYTTEEKRIIYSNYISKDDDIYKDISILEDGETNIDAYLEYKMQDIKSDEDTKSNIVGKKVSKGEGTSKNKTIEYINNSKLSDIEKLYIVETKYSNVLNNSEKEALLNFVTEKITDEVELEEVVKKFKDMEKHKDTGSYHWK